MKATLKALSLLSLLTLIACGQQNATLKAGDQNSHIIGGKAVPANSAVAHTTVAIFDVERSALCTGSLLTKNIVVTAAHCVQGGDPANYRIVFSTDLYAKNPEVRKVVAMTYNEKWDKADTASDDAKDLGDIGVIMFDGDLPKGYHPAKLLTDSSVITNGADVTLAGYGYTDGTAKNGEGTLRYTTVGVQDASFSPTEVELDQSQGKGACHGDSGGPAYIKGKNGKLALFGLTSRGENDPKDDCSVSSVYTNILSYQDWLKEAVASLQSKANAVHLVAKVN